MFHIFMLLFGEIKGKISLPYRGGYVSRPGFPWFAAISLRCLPGRRQFRDLVNNVIGVI
jgi:hypothetical protein